MEQEVNRSLDPLQTWHSAAAKSLPGLSTLVFNPDLVVVLAEGDPLRAEGIETDRMEGQSLAEVLPETVWRQMENDFRRALEGTSVSMEMPVSDGNALYWVQVTPMRREERVIGGVISSHEVAQRMVAEDSLLTQAGTFEAAFNKAPIGMALLALDGSLIRVNASFCRLTGYSENELTHMKFPELVRAEDLEGDLKHALRLMSGEIDSYSVEKRYITKSGETTWVLQASSIVRDDEGNPIHIILQLQDFSEQKELRSELRRIAEHDALTGLANRRRFVSALEDQIERCRRYDEKAGLLMLDLDDFKVVNDTYGHSAGDALLWSFGSDLDKRLRRNDLVARLGGDEFTVLLVGSDEDKASRLASQLMEYFDSRDLDAGGVTVGCRASIGSIGLDSETESADKALMAVDHSMYAVKGKRQSR